VESVEGDVGDVDFEVFVGVDFTSVTLQSEGFSLGGEGVLAMKSVKR